LIVSSHVTLIPEHSTAISNLVFAKVTVNTERKSSVIMLVLLAVVMVVYHVGVILYFVLGEEPLPTFEFLYAGAPQ
jgi:hypothetical protein